jgi:hypothetical protein
MRKTASSAVALLIAESLLLLPAISLAQSQNPAPPPPPAQQGSQTTQSGSGQSGQGQSGQSGQGSQQGQSTDPGTQQPTTGQTPAPTAGQPGSDPPVQQQQTVHPKNSKEDVDAIGNRNPGKGINFYSIEHEIALGKGLAQEVERSSKLNT